VTAASRPRSSADVVDETAGVGANQGRRRGRDTAERDYWFRAAGVRGRTPPLPRTEASASGSSHARLLRRDIAIVPIRLGARAAGLRIRRPASAGADVGCPGEQA
jgi:hypothetical protein